MPALVLFGRRWYIATDDFVIPSFLDLLGRLAWLIACLAVYWMNLEHLNECGGNLYIKSYLFGCIGVLTAMITIDAILVHLSKKGSIMDVEARKYVPIFVYLRTFLTLSELAWNTLGTIWMYEKRFSCENASPFENLLQGFTICNWVFFLLFILALWLVYNGNGGHFYELDLSSDKADPKVAKQWALRWKRALCYFWPNEKEKQSLQQIGESFALGFEDANMVISDFLVGAYLLAQQHGATKKSLKMIRDIEQSSFAKQKLEQELQELYQPTATPPVKTKIIPPIVNQPLSKIYNEQFKWLDHKGWDSIEMITHYSKYAVACYSYTLYSFWEPRAWLKLCSQGPTCCGCIPGRGPKEQVSGDNCLYLNTYAMKRFVRDDNCEVIYADFHNDICVSPFAVMVDHGTKAIVITIRGTLSSADFTTDLLIDEATIPGYSEEYFAHGGFLKATLIVKEKIDKLNLLPKLTQEYPDYTLVTTGTSLGAAIAALLAMILLPDYPSIKCYSYSASGSVVNEKTAKFCESFVVTVIYGDEIVSRLTCKSVERLKHDVKTMLYRCQNPKYQIILKLIWSWMTGNKPKFDMIDAEKLPRDPRMDLINYDEEASRSSVYGSESRSPSPSSLDSNTSLVLKFHNERLSATSEEPKMINFTRKMTQYPLMYLVGKLLHITETTDFSSRTTKKNPLGKPRWHIREADRGEFREILITSRLVLDHIPFRIWRALNDINRRATQKHVL